LDFFLAFAGGHAAVAEREFDVFVYGQLPNQIEGLENEANFAIADA
jgi:hypothetical protein